MVHGYLGTMNENLQVRNVRGRARIFFPAQESLLSPADPISSPWYCDPAIVGDKFSQDIAMYWYGRSHFTVVSDTVLGDFLEKEGLVSVRPRNAVRHINIDVDCRHCESSEHRTQLALNLAQLNQLTVRIARITVNLGTLSQNKAMQDLIFDTDQLAGKSLRDSSTGRVLQQREVPAANDQMLKRLQASVLHIFATTILPVFEPLLQKGHAATLRGEYLGWTWTWTPSMEEMTVSNLMEYWRRTTTH